MHTSEWKKSSRYHYLAGYGHTGIPFRATAKLSPYCLTLRAAAGDGGRPVIYFLSPRPTHAAPCAAVHTSSRRARAVCRACQRRG